MKVKGVSPRWF